MQKSFSFKGIARHSDNMLVPDGECLEIVNMRLRDGCLVPIPSVFNDVELQSAYDKIYWHPAASMYLCIEKDMAGNVHFYDENLNIVKGEGNGPELSLFPALEWVERIEFAGNIVCCIARETTFYLIYDTGKYRWLGERPLLPELTFSLDTSNYSVTTEDEYLPGVSLKNTDDALRWDNVSKGYFDECLAMLHGKGYYVDAALFRYALRLYDGSYLYYSPIYYVPDPNSDYKEYERESNFVSERVTAGATASKYRATVHGFMPTFHFNNLDLSAWENVVVSVDVFTSGSIYLSKVVNTKELSSRNSSSGTGYEKYAKKEFREMWNDVQDASLFYKVAEFSPAGELVDSVKDVSLSSIALCDALPDDTCSQVCRSASCSYFYNGRLHLAGLREKLFKGYNARACLPAAMDEARADNAVVVTKIKTTAGISVVKKEYAGDFVLGVSDGAYYLTPYIMYPDSRAFEMLFMIDIGGVVYRKSFTLKGHKSLNVAHYLHAASDTSTVSVKGQLQSGKPVAVYYPEALKAFFSYTAGEYEIEYRSDGYWYYGNQLFVVPERGEGGRYHLFIHATQPVVGDKLTIVIAQGNPDAEIADIHNIKIDATWETIAAIDDVEEMNAIEERLNVMKVSAVDNPFYFPPQNTYSPSQGEIVALCSNTVALSQGQFGQHPLLVFCKNGIWAMSGDASGSVAYASAHPLSREVCVSPSSLCAVDSGVVFLGANGLVMLQGGKLSSLSDVLYCDNPQLATMATGDIFYKISRLSYTHSSVSRISFMEYAKGAVVGYVAAENELWVSNNRYEYSYIYSLKNGSWSKISRSFTSFIIRYPGISAVTTIDDRSYVAVLGKEQAKEYAPVLLITRPQLWGTKLPKRVLQLQLHAAVKIATECEPYEFKGLGCYLLCSNDGVNFLLAAGCERIEDFSDMLFPYSPTHSYKYYIIALAGAIGLDSRVAGVELSVETTWNNRLR